MCPQPPRRLGAGFLMLVLLGGPAFSQTRAGDFARSDDDIEDIIERELEHDRVLFPDALDDLDIDVDEGVVTLEGEVPTLLTARRAERLATTVRGVQGVYNKLVVVPSTNRTADQISGDVRAALAAEPAIDLSALEVTAPGAGVVELNGRVSSYAARQIAERIAGSIRGVTRVDNYLKASTKPASDAELQQDVADALKWDTLVDGSSVGVNVNDGVVKLDGHVRSALAVGRARRIAFLSGAKSVDISNLAVQTDGRAVRAVNPPPLTDDLIKQGVQNALGRDGRIAPADLKIRVSDGVVTLSGPVRSVQARQAAARYAQSIRGVREVDNQLIVKATTTRSDQDITAAVRQALQRDATVGVDHIAVATERGVVTLTGAVPTMAVATEAEHVAGGQAGVVEVQNRIRVTGDEALTRRNYDPWVDDWDVDLSWNWDGDLDTDRVLSDAEIREDIDDEIWWSPFVDSEDVQVIVNDGVATLRGRVDSYHEFRSAEENAFEGGARLVKNELIIK